MLLAQLVFGASRIMAVSIMLLIRHALALISLAV
jgi:hypothetical protein